MYANEITSNIDSALPRLCARVLRQGHEFGSRAGMTKDVTHVGVTLTRPWEREITLPTRKHNLAAQIAETMWVLSGRDDVQWLERYLPRARDFSDDGLVWRGAYGKRIRRWPRRSDSADVVDQVAHVVRLLQEDPNTRRAVITIYDPDVDTAAGKDIPCNNIVGFSARRGILDVTVTIRSNDLMWGWSGINAFEWSALQEIVAGLTNLEIGSLHFNITSLHLYERHWERADQIAHSAGIVGQRSVMFSPRDTSVDYLDELFNLWFSIEQDIRDGAAHADAFVESFPEPMLQSWLRVLQWWWTGDEKHLTPLAGTRLETSALVAMQPKREPKVHNCVPEGCSECKTEGTPTTEKFVKYVTKLHTEKHAAYGDSWKRRGEMLGIMANIARKIDRLGGSATSDETAADTAIDLLVYLAKYRWWLSENAEAPAPITRDVGAYLDPATTNALIRSLGGTFDGSTWANAEHQLVKWFETLEQDVMKKDPWRYTTVDSMLNWAFPLALRLWSS